MSVPCGMETDLYDRMSACLHGTPLYPDTAERMLSVPAVVVGPGAGDAPAALAAAVEDRRSAIVGRAQERLGTFLAEEEDRLDNWREDAKVAFDQRIKALNKKANEAGTASRAAVGLAGKLPLQRSAAALKRQADDLQHQLYIRLREIDDEREAMLDDIAAQLALTPALTPLFTIRWSLT